MSQRAGGPTNVLSTLPLLLVRELIGCVLGQEMANSTAKIAKPAEAPHARRRPDPEEVGRSVGKGWPPSMVNKPNRGLRQRIALTSRIPIAKLIEENQTQLHLPKQKEALYGPLGRRERPRGSNSRISRT